MLTSSHGFTRNEVAFWTLESNNSKFQLEKQKTFIAHQRRVLNMVQSHDSNYLCTVGADETLKFWCLRSNDGNPFKNDGNKHGSEEKHHFRV